MTSELQNTELDDLAAMMADDSFTGETDLDTDIEWSRHCGHLI